ncbi:MAG TPA: ribonuclease HI [Chloroflexota bacterium]|nr:ribonuclease HI [Chloroflexota bacterium]
MPRYEVYSDGACSGNPGPGGWGAIVIFPDGHREELSGFEAQTTNNRMELTGALQGLSLVPNDAEAAVFSDSQYVINGGRSWLDGWKRKGWKTAGKTEVLNRDLWESLDAERERLRLSWEWVRGHNGHVLNERADTLARKAILSHGAPPPPKW